MKALLVTLQVLAAVATVSLAWAIKSGAMWGLGYLPSGIVIATAVLLTCALLPWYAFDLIRRARIHRREQRESAGRRGCAVR